MVLFPTFLSSRVIDAAFFTESVLLSRTQIGCLTSTKVISPNKNVLEQAGTLSMFPFPRQKTDGCTGKAMSTTCPEDLCCTNLPLALNLQNDQSFFFFTKMSADVKAGSINSAVWEGLLLELAFRPVKKRRKS